MRKIVFLAGIIGLTMLLAFLLNRPIKVSSIDGLLAGKIVEIEGMVEEERKYAHGKLLLINEIPVFCECKKGYNGKNVVVQGVIEKLEDDLRVRALFIEEG